MSCPKYIKTIDTVEISIEAFENYMSDFFEQGFQYPVSDTEIHNCINERKLGRIKETEFGDENSLSYHTEKIAGIVEHILSGLPIEPIQLELGGSEYYNIWDGHHRYRAIRYLKEYTHFPAEVGGYDIEEWLADLE